MRRSIKRTASFAPAALVLVAGSCTSQPVILPSRDFDRPTDIAFVCMGTFGGSGASADGGAADGGTTGAQVLSGRPMRECHPRGTVDVADTVHHTFAFLPNSSSGELSVVDADKWNLVNLDPANPGFNRLPLGVLPSQIAASDDGCRLVTANHGSCDLSFVDPAALLAPTVARDMPAVPPNMQMSVTSAGTTSVKNVIPRTKNSGQALRVLAGEVAFLPIKTDTFTKNENLCSGDPDHQWQALATFPSCDLVALIDLPSGYIQQAAYVKKTADGGVALVPLADGEDPVCPVDCQFPPVPAAPPPASIDGGGTDAEEAGAPEGGAPDAGVAQPGDGGAVEAGIVEAGAPEVAPPPVDPGDVPYVGPGALRPGPIAIVPESRRAYVGLANAAFVLAFNVGQDQFAVDPSVIPLHEGALGVERVRLSIDPYKDKTTGSGISGTFVGDDPAVDTNAAASPATNAAVSAAAPDRQYLYVIARDGTLRVVQVAHAPVSETECETNVDFTSPNVKTAVTDACQPVVGPSVRLPGAIGPGIRLPTPPIDIAVADIRPQPVDNSENSVSGAHAWVLTASGNVYLVNIDPVTRFISGVDASKTDLTTQLPIPTVKLCEAPTGDMCLTEPEPAPNTVRNRAFLGFTASLDPSLGPARLDLPPAQATIGPRIEALWTVGSADNATAVSADYIRTSVFFPNPSIVTPQTWLVTWEGNLMASPRLTGQIVRSSPSSPATLQDIGMDFCRTGTQVNDIVTLEGCTTDAQCGIGKKCIHGSNGAEGAGNFPILGLCLSPATPEAYCNDLLSTIRRYDVTTARQTELVLAPHKDELVRPSLKPCSVTSTPRPGADAGADAGLDGSTEGGDASTDGAVNDAGRDALPSLVSASDCVDPNDPSTSNFQCVSGRCLYPCSKPGETTGCRPGRICVDFGNAGCSDGQCFCADGPKFEQNDFSANPAMMNQARINECLGELLPYQLSVGRGFAVTGSSTPLPVTGIADASGACVPFPDLDPRLRVRIPMDAPRCAPPLTDNTLDSRCDPNLTAPDPGCPMINNTIPPTNPTARQLAAATTAQKLSALAQTPNDPNPCMYIGGPNETDIPNALPEHIHAIFRNREVQFTLTNLERPPTGVFQIRFDVHGGFQAQTVAIPTTVEVTMPARLVLGPFDSNNPANGTAGVATAEVPYLFVVDQRRLGRTQGGGPTRGQLLRIHPRGFTITIPVTGSQPWFEDLSHSNNLFPIQ
jgi:hypothetical protein